ncbi:uncharacterized protein KY384_007262 [Bacidia gigantensis]|uniref:uncharacterized protein n=1 Tax=Bacidia gigantensis TaxID=2732470 RepID=UPI001D05125E|nr:uncharacterized protein KY384_007262 [Bacidia gigantensis]KAG8528344.1 hypothetical protein KY384_007262 [Bacidia gigantensis]
MSSLQSFFEERRKKCEQDQINKEASEKAEREEKKAQIKAKKEAVKQALLKDPTSARAVQAKYAKECKEQLDEDKKHRELIMRRAADDRVERKARDERERANRRYADGGQNGDGGMQWIDEGARTIGEPEKNLLSREGEGEDYGDIFEYSSSGSEADNEDNEEMENESTVRPRNIVGTEPRNDDPYPRRLAGVMNTPMSGPRNDDPYPTSRAEIRDYVAKRANERLAGVMHAPMSGPRYSNRLPAPLVDDQDNDAEMADEPSRTSFNTSRGNDRPNGHHPNGHHPNGNHPNGNLPNGNQYPPPDPDRPTTQPSASEIAALPDALFRDLDLARLLLANPPPSEIIAIFMSDQYNVSYAVYYWIHMNLPVFMEEVERRGFSEAHGHVAEGDFLVRWGRWVKAGEGGFSRE